VTMTKTIIEFQRVIGTDEAGDPIVETIDAVVTADGVESATITLPAGGKWECDAEELHRATA
jgi:hypothetical protein